MRWDREGGGAGKWSYYCSWPRIVLVSSHSLATTASRLVWHVPSLMSCAGSLSAVTADEMKAIVTAASSSGGESFGNHMSSDEDEGDSDGCCDEVYVC